MKKRPRPMWKSARDNLLPLCLLLIPTIACMLSETPFVLLLGLSAILWHESGHLFFFLLCKSPPPRLFADAFGLRLQAPLPLSPKKEALICLGGPLFNLLAALVLLLGKGDFFRLYATLHLMLAFFNLFPVYTTDGGRILLSLLRAFLPAETAEKIFRLFSALLLSFLFFFCAFLFYFGGIGLYGVFFSVFFFWKTVCDDFNKKGDFKSF